MAINLKRQLSKRPQRIKIYIFMEGKNTEPVYFKSYERYTSCSRIEPHYEKENGVPKTLFRLAEEKISIVKSKKYIKENGDKDQVWIVFDRDEHQDVWNILNQCKVRGIKTAFSNPCFELWIILHLEDYDKDEHRYETQKYCEKICDGYDQKKRKIPEMSFLMENVEKAEDRAIILKNRRDEDKGEAPLTTVYNLTRAIRGVLE